MKILRDFKIPGDFVSDEEELDDAASRVLSELTGLDNIYLEQFKTFGSPYRLSKSRDKAWLRTILPDVRHRIVTIAYYALVPLSIATPNSAISHATWYNINDLPNLPFDHDLILKEALDALRQKVSRDPIVYELLPQRFTLTQLQRCYEVILGKKLDKRNFRKRISNLQYLTPLEEWQQNVAHKPARLYSFNQAKYEKNMRNNLYFST